MIYQFYETWYQYVFDNHLQYMFMPFYMNNHYEHYTHPYKIQFEKNRKSKIAWFSLFSLFKYLKRYLILYINQSLQQDILSYVICMLFYVISPLSVPRLFPGIKLFCKVVKVLFRADYFSKIRFKEVF